MVYLITYDLKTKNRDYTSLYTTIQQLGECIHPLESVWFADTRERNLNADQITAILRANMADADLLFVVSVDESDRNGWMAKSAWPWIRGREVRRSQPGNRSA